MAPLVRENRLRPEASCEGSLLSHFNGGAGVAIYRGGFLPKTRIAYVASARDTTKHGNRRR